MVKLYSSNISYDWRKKAKAVMDALSHLFIIHLSVRTICWYWVSWSLSGLYSFPLDVYLEASSAVGRKTWNTLSRYCKGCQQSTRKSTLLNIVFVFWQLFFIQWKKYFTWAVLYLYTPPLNHIIHGGHSELQCEKQSKTGKKLKMLYYLGSSRWNWCQKLSLVRIWWRTKIAFPSKREKNIFCFSGLFIAMAW